MKITDTQEAVEFDFDWSATLRVNIEFGKRSNFLTGNCNKTKLPKMRNTMTIHAKMEDNHINGLIRIFGKLPVDKFNPCHWKLESGLSFIGRFEDGIPTGVCWRGLIGGAWLYGEVDEIGEFTGDQIAYIYPDLKTSFLGRFVNGTMVGFIFRRIL